MDRVTSLGSVPLISWLCVTCLLVSGCASAGVVSREDRDGPVSEALILGAALGALVDDPHFPYMNNWAVTDSLGFCVRRVTESSEEAELPRAVQQRFSETRQLRPASACPRAYHAESGGTLWAPVTEGDAVSPTVVHIYLSAPYVELTEAAWVPVRTYYNGLGLIVLCRVRWDAGPFEASCTMHDTVTRIWR